MRPPIRLAVLECDTPLPNTKETYKGYGGVFESLLRRGAKASNLDPDQTLKIQCHQIEADPSNYPRLEDVDAILITGSRHDAWADTPWIHTLVDYTQKALDSQRVRTIGVCFGHQIVGRALGAQVGRNDDGWEAAVNDIQLTSKGKELFGVDGDKMRLHQMHRDIVYNYPQGVEELGYSPVCKVQGMYVKDKLITVQGHPEFNQEIMEEIIETRHTAGVFDKTAREAHMGKTRIPHDGVTVSKAFLKFLLDE